MKLNVNFSMTHLSTLLLSAISAVVALWLWRSEQQQQLEMPILQSQLILQQMMLINYHQDGSQRSKIFATQGDVALQNGDITLLEPQIIENKDGAQLHISAARALINATQTHYQFTQDVIITRDEQQLRSQRIDYDSDYQLAYSPVAFTYNSARNYLQADSGFWDLAAQRLILKNNIHGSYE